MPQRSIGRGWQRDDRVSWRWLQQTVSAISRRIVGPRNPGRAGKGVGVGVGVFQLSCSSLLGPSLVPAKVRRRFRGAWN